MSTGSELREPGAELAADSIYEGNSFLLAGAALRAGVEVHRLGIVPDDPDAFLAALRGALGDGDGADAVVTSGGVSQGDYDVVKAALRPLGTVWFGGVAMQPGKPQGYGRVDGTPIFTLPGNPVSSYISFQVFVLPALHRMMGRERERVGLADRSAGRCRSCPRQPGGDSSCGGCSAMVNCTRWAARALT